MFILLAYDVFEPCFGKVFDILSTDIGVFVVYHEYTTQYFDNHYHAYAIEEAHKFLSISKITAFPFFLVFYSRHTFSQNDSCVFINFKTYIEN